MPMYNLLCENCKLDEDTFATYDEFIAHSSSECPIECPKCKELKAFYSLTHLKENLNTNYKDVMNFYGPSVQEQWYRGFEGLGKR
jgi:phage FluMu protein Com